MMDVGEIGTTTQNILGRTFSIRFNIHWPGSLGTKVVDTLGLVQGQVAQIDGSWSGTVVRLPRGRMTLNPRVGYFIEQDWTFLILRLSLPICEQLLCKRAARSTLCSELFCLCVVPSIYAGILSKD